MTKRKDTKERILEAAMREFAARGFGGARMDTIARNAEINKAMLHYYFDSKENLYQTVIQNVLEEYVSQFKKIISPHLSPEKLMEEMPKLVITFFSGNQDLIKLIGLELFQNPANITSRVSAVVQRGIIKGPQMLEGLIKKWYQQGLISEPEPIHFAINIMSLSLFAFVVKPMVASIFNRSIEDDEQFFKDRIDSVINVLKRGMLK